MNKTNKGGLPGGLDLGGSCALSRLDLVGADVWLRLRLSNLADEDRNLAKGDPLPVLD